MKRNDSSRKRACLEGTDQVVEKATAPHLARLKGQLQVIYATVRRYPSVIIVPLVIFILAVGLGVFGVVAGMHAMEDARKDGARQLASTTLAAFQLTIQQAYTTVAAIAVYVEQNPHWPTFKTDFERMAKSLLDASYQVGGVGADLLLSCCVDDAMREVTARTLKVDGPYALQQGGSALLASLPVFLPSNISTPGPDPLWEAPLSAGNCSVPACYDPITHLKWYGTVYLLLFVEKLVKDSATKLPDLDDSGWWYTLQKAQMVEGKTNLRPVLASRGGELRDPIVVSAEIGGTEYMLLLAPSSGWSQEWWPAVVTGVVLLGFLLAGLVFAAMINKRQTTWLLYSILPRQVVQTLQRGSHWSQRRDCCVLFADVVGFTRITSTMEPEDIATMVGQLFCMYEEMTSRHGLTKVDIIGDCFMAAAGMLVPETPEECAVRTARLALDMVSACHGLVTRDGTPIQVRIGLHAGPVVAVVVGVQSPKLTVFGDVVNTCSRLQSTSLPGCVQVSEIVAERLVAAGPEAQGMVLVSRGDVELKNRGTLSTWWVQRLGSSAELSSAPSGASRDLSGLQGEDQQQDEGSTETALTSRQTLQLEQPEYLDHGPHCLDGPGQGSSGTPVATSTAHHRSSHASEAVLDQCINGSSDDMAVDHPSSLDASNAMSLQVDGFAVARGGPEALSYGVLPGLPEELSARLLTMHDGPEQVSGNGSRLSPTHASRESSAVSGTSNRQPCSAASATSVASDGSQFALAVGKSAPQDCPVKALSGSVGSRKPTLIAVTANGSGTPESMSVDRSQPLPGIPESPFAPFKRTPVVSVQLTQVGRSGEAPWALDSGHSTPAHDMYSSASPSAISPCDDALPSWTSTQGSTLKRVPSVTATPALVPFSGLPSVLTFAPTHSGSFSSAPAFPPRLGGSSNSSSTSQHRPSVSEHREASMTRGTSEIAALGGETVQNKHYTRHDSTALPHSPAVSNRGASMPGNTGEEAAVAQPAVKGRSSLPTHILSTQPGAHSTSPPRAVPRHRKSPQRASTTLLLTTPASAPAASRQWPSGYTRAGNASSTSLCEMDTAAGTGGPPTTSQIPSHASRGPQKLVLGRPLSSTSHVSDSHAVLLGLQTPNFVTLRSSSQVHLSSFECGSLPLAHTSSTAYHDGLDQAGRGSSTTSTTALGSSLRPHHDRPSAGPYSSSSGFVDLDSRERQSRDRQSGERPSRAIERLRTIMPWGGISMDGDDVEKQTTKKKPKKEWSFRGGSSSSKPAKVAEPYWGQSTFANGILQYTNAHGSGEEEAAGVGMQAPGSGRGGSLA